MPGWGQKPIVESRRLCERADRLVTQTRERIVHLDWYIDKLRRAYQPDFFRPLHDAIRAMYGCESRHVASFAVHNADGKQVVWVGLVEEFALLDHPGAPACYGWCYGKGITARTFTLLKQPPIDSPQQAVQFFLLAKEKPQPDALMGASS